MKLSTRIRRLVDGEHGPATRNTLRGVARAHGQEQIFEITMRMLLADGHLRMIGKGKGAMYGAPKSTRSKPAARAAQRGV